MEERGEFPLVWPDNIHRYFGGFQMIYDPDFREFFFDNYDLLFSDLDDQDTYLSYLSVLQNRFAEIKAVYSNVHLTLDLAISYISVNQYNNINTGNAKVSRAAGIQKYSQDDFEIIQKIFNYGKQRVSSSIPRIESKESINLPSGSYKYEILRLDDPRAMSIGFESTCCQRLHDAAELCMEHSMLDKNGRVFVVTNEKNELVSQSWVWRNGNVICFDNIEVPNPKMWANGISRGREDDGIRNQFTDDVLNVYKIASQELIKEDEKVLKNLLDNNKITQETYDSYKLNKITIGEGYSNIKGSFVTLPRIKGRLDRPLHFAPPIPLGGYFYTDDSNKQYLLEKNGDINSTNAATLPVHYDTFVEHTDSTMTLFDYENLVQLDVATKPDQSYRDVAIRDFEDNKDCIVSEIARNYCLNPDTTRIIIHPNFAIIYDVNDNNLRIADLLFNTKIDNDEQHFDIENVVAMQMKLALDQISEGKNVNISKLDSFQVDMYNKALSMDEELDNERGVGHAR